MSLTNSEEHCAINAIPMQGDGVELSGAALLAYLTSYNDFP